MSHHVYHHGRNSSSHLHYECTMSPRLSHHHVICIMASRPSSRVMSSASSSNQLDHMSSSCTSSSQLDQSPQELYHRHHQVINWTMGSTIRYMAPLHQTGSISIIKIIKAQGTIINSPRLHEHHLQASIWLHHVVTTTRVTIK